MIQRMFVTLDTKKTNYKNVGKINHGDDLILELTVLSDGDMISFNDPMVDLLVKKSDGKMIRQNSGIEHIKPNKFIIEVKKDCVTSPGLSTNQLIINDNGRISTCMFYYTILNSLEEDIIESISNVEVLEQLDEFTIQIKDKMENFDEELQNRMSELEDAIDDLVEFFGDSSVDLLEAELSRNEAEQSRAQAESIRVQNENRRLQNDLDLANAEAERVRAENIRIQNEVDRALVDAVMDQKESKRDDSELERIQNESKRATDEKLRQQNENTRQSNESVRISNENDRKTQENRRVTAETNRVNAETTRRNNENSRITNEIERQKAMNEMKSLIGNVNDFDERVDVIEDEIEEINSSLDTNVRKQQLRELNLYNPLPPLKGVKQNDDSSAELLELLNYAKENNIKNLYLPSGVYQFNNVDLTDFSCNLYGDGNDTVITRNSYSDYAICFRGTTELIGSIIGIDNNKNPKIYVNDTSNLKIGDVVKIVSDDKLEGMKLSYDYKGEFKVVRKIGNGFIEVGGKLRNTYETNLRLLKNSETTYNISNIMLTTDNVNSTNRIASILKFRGGINHKIKNVHITDTMETGILLKNCYGYTINNVSFGYQINSSDTEEETNKIGYGIVDTCGGFFNIKNISNRFTRHSFTTGSGQDLDFLDKYGISEYGVFENSISNGGSSAGFDIHEQSYGITFNNCTSTNGNSHGLQIRGVNNTIKNCFIDNNYDGVSILQGSGLNNLKECKILDTYVKSNNLALNIKSDNTDDDVKNLLDIEIRNCKFDGVNKNVLQKANVKFYNCTFIIEDQFLFNVKGKLNTAEFYNCDIIFKNTSHSTKYLFNIENTSSLGVKLFNCKIFNSDTVPFEFKISNFYNTKYYYNSPILADNLYVDSANVTLSTSSNSKEKWTNKTDSGDISINVLLSQLGVQ